MKHPFPINESQFAQLAENYRKIEKGSDPLNLSTVVKLRLTDFEVRWALVAIDPLIGTTLTRFERVTLLPRRALSALGSVTFSRSAP